MKLGWKYSAAAWAGVLVCLFLGCSGDRIRTAPVRGKVSYKGKALTHGTVMFVPDEPGPAATAEIQKDGSYVLQTPPHRQGAVIGSHTVAITVVEDTSGRLPEERNPLPPMLLPDKYSNNKRSGLKATVEDKDNVINFDLK
jgi:hypothetical protein